MCFNLLFVLEFLSLHNVIGCVMPCLASFSFYILVVRGLPIAPLLKI